MRKYNLCWVFKLKFKSNEISNPIVTPSSLVNRGLARASYDRTGPKRKRLHESDCWRGSYMRPIVALRNKNTLHVIDQSTFQITEIIFLLWTLNCILDITHLRADFSGFSFLRCHRLNHISHSLLGLCWFWLINTIKRIILSKLIMMNLGEQTDSVSQLDVIHT